jgi:hypothetical protein
MTAGGRLLPGALLAVSAVLLLSMGGAVVAAPVTVPALVWAARRRLRGGLRAAAVAVAALTAAELGWAAVYLAVGETEPAIWLVPLAAGLATALAAALPARRMAVTPSAGCGRANR